MKESRDKKFDKNEININKFIFFDNSIKVSKIIPLKNDELFKPKKNSRKIIVSTSSRVLRSNYHKLLDLRDNNNEK